MKCKRHAQVLGASGKPWPLVLCSHAVDARLRAEGSFLAQAERYAEAPPSPFTLASANGEGEFL